MSNFEGEGSSLENQLENISCEETRLDGDGNCLVKVVENLARDIGDVSNLGGCHINLIDQQKSGLAVCNNDIISCHIKTETGCNQVINGFERSTSCNVIKGEHSPEETRNDMQSVAVGYFENLESSNQDLLSKVNSDNGGACIIKIQSSSDHHGYRSSAKKQSFAKEQDESPSKTAVKSESNNLFSVAQESQDNESFILTSDGLEACLLRDTREPDDSSDSTGISLIKLISETSSLVEGMNDICTETDSVKEETVIHVVDSGSISRNVEDAVYSTSIEPSVISETFPPVLEAIDADILRKGHVKELMADSASLTLSLPFVNTPTSLNTVVMDGSLMIRNSDDAPVQVPAKLIYIPETNGSLELSEEMFATFAPKLLENSVLVPGDNIIILGSRSFLTSVELILVEGETQTQISISPLTESMEAYQDKGVNFVMITRNLEQGIALPSNSSQTGLKLNFDILPEQKYPLKNAPHSDEPGLFQCDKCDKTYKIRSSLNSHKVTHNAEKMYKCDECDKAFHYSTPLQNHKRIHSDERPYRCQSCNASFRSKANLRYHERVHTGERPITCRECGQGFKDYTSLKRHRQKAHAIVSIKCDECGQNCSSVDSLTNHLWQSHNILCVNKIFYCKKCGEALANQKTYNIHMANHERVEKISQGSRGRLSDYNHRCGICNMICQNKPQMLVHIQIHAAVKRFQCRYCKNAFIYRFLLARHVREEHPNDPQWFCQHCDVTFETCRKMNTHSCRTFHGDYACPHCDFKTEIRHRLFRHIVRVHPEDKAPYYCDFCKSSFEDPSKLRYHQKREHPEKMLMLSMQREARHIQTTGGKIDSPTIDMSQVEMTIEGSTIIYYIPKHLRNDEIFKEKVKFKCFYCEAKFPVKNTMTRHILREHPGEKAYKCLRCNIFLKSNVASKNHNRKYHKYSDTGGRDPLRNEKAMKKKAQMLEQQLKQAEGQLKNIYKFHCRFCSMVYRCKRSLVVHYKKWHPDEDWDYLPDKPSRTTNMPSKRKRKLLFFDCRFDDHCHMVFDDMTMLLEHLCNAHNVKDEEAEKYVSKRIVVETVRRGRLPKNAIDVVTNANSRNRKNRKNNAHLKNETEDEEDVDDPAYCDEELDSKPNGVNEKKSHSIAGSSSLNYVQTNPDFVLGSAAKKQKSVPFINKKSFKTQMKLEDIGSVRDVKKMLYRCRKCSLSFPSKNQYREHSSQYSDVDCRDFLHLNIKQEPKTEREESDDYDDGDENYQLSSEEDDEFDEVIASKRSKRFRNSKKTGMGLNQSFDLIIKSESHSITGKMNEDIVVTALDEDNTEDVLKVLTINASEMGHPRMQIKVEIITPEITDLESEQSIFNGSKTSKLPTFKSSPLTSIGNISKREKADGHIYRDKVSRRVNSCYDDRSLDHSSNLERDIEYREDSKVPEKRSRLIRGNTLSESQRRGNIMTGSQTRGNTVAESLRRGNTITRSQTTQCEECQVLFKTRAELSFHRRLDHK